jgi:Protein of unknown function (DUF3467)
MSDDTATQEPATEHPHATAPPMQMVYANVAGIRASAFDVSVEFGHAIPASEGEVQIPPNWLVRVAMSWEHARALRDLLDKQLEAYETQVGPLPDTDKLKAGDTR